MEQNFVLLQCFTKKTAKYSKNNSKDTRPQSYIFIPNEVAKKFELYQNHDLAVQIFLVTLHSKEKEGK